MSTTIERRNGTYTLIDNGVETIVETITKDGLSLILPENSSGRKFFALKKFEKSETHELLAINRNPDAERPTSRKSLLDYMSAEDKVLYDAIMERCKKAREEATKKQPLTDIEKAELRVKRAMEALEALKNKEAQA